MRNSSSPFSRPFTSVAAVASDVATCLRFFSRLPVPRLPFEATDGSQSGFATAVRTLPLAGVLIGSCSAVPLWLASEAGLPATIAAALATACAVLSTGGLHEDGLADMADGFGGGATPERKLVIMRDSRIGTYGVLAIALAVLLRVGCLGALLDRAGTEAAVMAVLGSSGVSRAFAMLPIALLPPARTDGLGRNVGRPSPRTLGICFGMAALVGCLPLLAGAGLHHVVLACGLACLGAAAVTRLAWRHIGGQTGDIAGASQQVSEIGWLLGLLLFPSWA